MRGGAKRLGLAVRALALDFGNRDLGLLGVARVGASFAIWSFTIALGVYGFEAHGALGVGLIALVRLLPGAVAAPFAGLLVDRYSRRAVLLWCALAMTIVLAGAAVAATLDAPTGVVYAFTALFAIASCAYIPAESALIPGLAHTPQELSASNVTHSAMENLGFLLAALGAGFILTATSTEVVFTVAAAVAAVTTFVILLVGRDSRPVYAQGEGEMAGVAAETVAGLRALFEHPALRLSSLTLIALMFFEGFADVAIVVVALELLHLGDGSVGFLNAAWGFGALVGGAGLAMLLDRGKLVVAIAGGSLVIGVATMVPGFWPDEATTYNSWLAVGIGFTFVEVAAKTLMQRLGDDETLGRVIASLESARLSAMAVGSIAAILAIELLHPQNTLILLGAVMPLFVLACWTKLRAFEVGAPVAEGPFRLLRHNSIFAPLPIATLERLSHDLVEVAEPAGREVIVQGEHGDRFYLIEEGEVEVFENGEFRRNEGPGESFGEIALLHDVPRTATVRTTVETRLLVLEREQFLTAVTGHRRSRQVAHTVVEGRWPGDDAATAPSE
ncbi:MAG TPA: MFS transporter [Solirubrobacterales bacterium]